MEIVRTYDRLINVLTFGDVMKNAMRSRLSRRNLERLVDRLDLPAIEDDELFQLALSRVTEIDCEIDSTCETDSPMQVRSLLKSQRAVWGVVCAVADLHAARMVGLALKSIEGGLIDSGCSREVRGETVASC